MPHWLIKSDPDAWSWDDQTKAKTTQWDGVRNHQAANNLKAMKNGDLALFYHSVIGKQVVGIVQVTREYRPDPSDKTGRFGMVDVKAVRPFKNPVPLAAIKAELRLADLPLIRQSRLSVMPVTAAHYKLICKMGNTTP